MGFEQLLIFFQLVVLKQLWIRVNTMNTKMTLKVNSFLLFEFNYSVGPIILSFINFGYRIICIKIKDKYCK